MSINLTLIAQMLAFAALIWLVATKIWPPLLNAIEERQKKIAEGLAAADNSQKALAEAEEKANEELKAARAKAVEEGARQKAIVEADIAASVHRAREELRKQVSALVVSGAEKLIRREIDPAAHRALLDELAAEI